MLKRRLPSINEISSRSPCRIMLLSLKLSLICNLELPNSILAIDQWDKGLSELLEWFDNAEAMGNPPGPSAHALLAQIYLYFASETPKDSPEEKQLL